MSNYKQLTKKELINYIKQHPLDEDAFQYYLTIMRAKPGIVVSTEEQALAECAKKVRIRIKTLINNEKGSLIS